MVSYTSWCRDRRSSVKARPRHHPFGPELLVAPGADNQIRLARDHLIHGCDAIHGGASVCTVGEDAMPPAISTSSATHPTRRSAIVPLLERYLRLPRQAFRTLTDFSPASLGSAHKLPGPFARIDNCAERPDHLEDPRDASLVEGMNVEPATDEIGGDVNLRSENAKNEVGLQRHDFVNVRRGEGTHTRLFAASLRARDIAGGPDDAVLVAKT